ncbi:MAG: hypothetical protein Q9218_007337 [Villophora microphyllina]
MGKGIGDTAESKSQKEMNEDFFARKGNENERRRADLPPSQGGKYAGFGSAPPVSASGGDGVDKGIPGVDEFQKDPVAALTKGFGWFTTTVSQKAKTVNEGWVKPGVQKLAEADLTTQARQTAAQVAQNIQTGSKNAAEQFNRFVEDSSSSGPSSLSHSRQNAGSSRSTKVEPEHKDFWDSFGSPAAEDHGTAPARGVIGEMSGSGRNSPAPGKANAIGTAAMRKGPKEREKEEDKWEDF